MKPRGKPSDAPNITSDRRLGDVKMDNDFEKDITALEQAVIYWENKYKEMKTRFNECIDKSDNLCACIEIEGTHDMENHRYDHPMD